MAKKNEIDCGQTAIKMLNAIYDRIEKKHINLEKNNLDSFTIMILLEDCPYCYNVITAIQRSFKVYGLDCKLHHYKFNLQSNKSGYSFCFTNLKPNFDDLPF